MSTRNCPSEESAEGTRPYDEDVTRVLDVMEKPAEIPETIDAGPITLQRWTVDLADDLDRAINESLPELMRFMPWASADHDLEATTGYLVQSWGEWENGENFSYAMRTTQGQVVGGCGLMSRRGPGVFEIG